MAFAFLSNEVEYKIDESWEFHLGKLSLNVMEKYSKRIQQVDVFNDIVETHEFVRSRSIRVAQALKQRGIGLNDVVILCGPNHTNICLPLLASLYIGAATMPLAEHQTISEWCHWLNLSKPKIIFCQDTQADVAEIAMKKVGLSVEIVVFGDCDRYRFTTFADFLKENEIEDTFRVTDFDTATTPAIISCTSGSTGYPKAVCLMHRQISMTFHLPAISHNDDDLARHVSLCPSTLFWLSGTLNVLICTIYGQSRLISPVPYTADLVVKTIRKYRPTMGAAISSILTHPDIRKLDMKCFEYFFLVGAVLPQKILDELKVLSPNADLINFYGSTECCGAMSIAKLNNSKNNTCGKPLPWIQWKIVNPLTYEKLPPNEQGELWVKGPTCFKKYFNDHVSTRSATSNDGWYKTGDIMYYDDNNNLYFVDRQKEIMKYKGCQISPMELEMVICQLEGVRCCCVVGKESEQGDLPLAFVERTRGSKITADDVKNIVKESLAEWKQIRGGVVFIDALPMTPSAKIDRKRLKQMRDNVVPE